MPEPYIRPTAIAVLLWRDHLLATRYTDRDRVFYRPLGGGIDFGEHAVDAVRREFREELQREIEVVHLLGVAENIFTINGDPGHQLMFEFIARWPEGAEPADLAPIAGVEGNGDPLDARWLPLDDVFDGAFTLYPDGLAERIQSWLSKAQRR